MMGGLKIVSGWNLFRLVIRLNASLPLRFHQRSLPTLSVRNGRLLEEPFHLVALIFFLQDRTGLFFVYAMS